MKYRPMFPLAMMIVAAILFTGCVTIRPGEVGLKQRFGKLHPQVYGQGLVGYNPFVTTILKVPIRTENLEVRLNLPSEDGLNVASEISILYKVNPSMARDIIETIGSNYQQVVILSVFRSAAADVCSRFLAKDMYTASRAVIESEIMAQMSRILEPRGFVIEAVLLKSIQLPPGLTRAIEQKLEAEQVAEQMEYALQRERLEAQRRIIEAEGIRDAQKIISSGLSPEVISWQSIEAFRALADSPNTKIIITDGHAPLLIDGVN
ncbi:MAG: prohibitin family protein [Bacteroidia bacterium]|nr:prohibitin family protein [Bacteroidia bacterium]